MAAAGSSGAPAPLGFASLRGVATLHLAMFIAMNRFRIARGFEDGFEALWRRRESHLEGVPGFRSFHLLRGPSGESETLYASHTTWDSRDAFEAWTRSEAFLKAHAQARAPKGTYLDHPKLEAFDIVL
jgi:heme-degrading monooxygenase HmoA